MLNKRTHANLYNKRPGWLDLAPKQLAAASGWRANLSEEQILEKLLALNLERAGAEGTSAKVKKPKPHANGMGLIFACGLSVRCQCR